MEKCLDEAQTVEAGAQMKLERYTLISNIKTIFDTAKDMGFSEADFRNAIAVMGTQRIRGFFFKSNYQRSIEDLEKDGYKLQTIYPLVMIINDKLAIMRALGYGKGKTAYINEKLIL